MISRARLAITSLAFMLVVRLCTIAGTLESIAPEIKELDITEVMELLERIFHKEETQTLVHRMKINHDSKLRRAKEG